MPEDTAGVTASVRDKAVYPLQPKPLPEQERLWLELYRTLGETDRRTLLAFGEFLAARQTGVDPEPVPIPEPLPSVRPEVESVVGAIRRLSESYRMLDRSALLHETAALMSAHVLQGRLAASVIDDLEALFSDHYARWRAARSSG